MKQGIVAPIPTDRYEMSRGVAAVLEAIKKLDPGQQITVLRNTVVDMGFEPVAASTVQRAAEPMFTRTEPAPTQITVEGITETTVSYFKAMNADDFETALALFTPALQPPFQKPIVGREAIASYMCQHKDSILCRSRAYQRLYQMALSRLKSRSPNSLVRCQRWDEHCVAVLTKSQGKIFFVAIDMLASPQELLSLRRM